MLILLIFVAKNRPSSAINEAGRVVITLHVRPRCIAENGGLGAGKRLHPQQACPLHNSIKDCWLHGKTRAWRSRKIAKFIYHLYLVPLSWRPHQNFVMNFGKVEQCAFSVAKEFQWEVQPFRKKTDGENCYCNITFGMWMRGNIEIYTKQMTVCCLYLRINYSVAVVLFTVC